MLWTGLGGGDVPIPGIHHPGNAHHTAPGTGGGQGSGGDERPAPLPSWTGLNCTPQLWALTGLLFTVI